MALFIDGQTLGLGNVINNVWNLKIIITVSDMSEILRAWKECFIVCTLNVFTEKPVIRMSSK